MKEIKIGSDYDEEWIEYQFQTHILPYCNEHGESDDFRPAQEAFLTCLYEKQAPMATAKYFRDKLQALLKIKTDANQPTKAILACLDYLKFQIEGEEPPHIPVGPKAPIESITVTGDTKDLDAIYGLLLNRNDIIQLSKHGGPGSVVVPNEYLKAMGLPPMLSTIKLTIQFREFRGKREQIKSFIIKTFPKVMIN